MDKQGFTEYLQGKNLAGITIREYILNAKRFFEWVKKEDIQVTKPDILRYLEYLKNKRGIQNTSRQNHLFTLKHYFAFLNQSGQITGNPCAFLKLRGTKVKKLCRLYTGEELNELYDNYYNVYIRNFQTSKYFGKATEEYILLKRKRNLVTLGILIYQGTLISELKNIKLADMDLQKGTINIPASRRAKERTLPLKAPQIGAIIDYIQNIKPKLERLYQKTANEDYLFSVENRNFDDVIKHLNFRLKGIDRNFINCTQIRTSVITHWLKTENLRKTQYLAGHRSIQCTERYLPNNLENLIDEITQHHPFII
jgi:integrase/recombinase XerD